MDVVDVWMSAVSEEKPFLRKFYRIIKEVWLGVFVLCLQKQILGILTK